VVRVVPPGPRSIVDDDVAPALVPAAPVNEKDTFEPEGVRVLGVW